MDFLRVFLFLHIDQNGNFPAQQVVNRQRDMARLCKTELDGRGGVERIGIIRKQGDRFHWAAVRCHDEAIKEDRNKRKPREPSHPNPFLPDTPRLRRQVRTPGWRRVFLFAVNDHFQEYRR